MKLNPLVTGLAVGCSFFATLVLQAQKAETTPKADATFVRNASQGGLAEVELGKLAEQQGSNNAVKDFGKQMQADHGKANDELKAIAAQEKLTVATSMRAKDKSLENRLSKMSGAQFDQSYVKAMIEDHKADIAEFQKEADNGQNAEIKNFAAKTLPTLKHHLQMAEDAASQIGIKSTGGF